MVKERWIAGVLRGSGDRRWRARWSERWRQ